MGRTGSATVVDFDLSRPRDRRDPPQPTGLGDLDGRLVDYLESRVDDGDPDAAPLLADWRRCRVYLRVATDARESVSAILWGDTA